METKPYGTTYLIFLCFVVVLRIKFVFFFSICLIKINEVICCCSISTSPLFRLYWWFRCNSCRHLDKEVSSLLNSNRLLLPKNSSVFYVNTISFVMFILLVNVSFLCLSLVVSYHHVLELSIILGSVIC